MTHIQIDKCHWLNSLAETERCFCIIGETGTGKFTLAANLVGALQQSCPDLDVTVLDPRPGFSNQKSSKVINLFDSFDECLAKAKEIEKHIDQQVKQAGNRKAGILLIHEIDALLIAARNQNNSQEIEQIVRKLLLKWLNQGPRAKVICTAQSSGYVRAGLSSDPFENSVKIFLGQRILEALNEELRSKISKKEKRACLGQYDSLNQQGDFCCLVKAPGYSPFIATLPEPGHNRILN
jgi:ABC-type dipeptide/oligopeptide/nickel transport system ATPase subunit